jgi:hypothetical protein
VWRSFFAMAGLRENACTRAGDAGLGPLARPHTTVARPPAVPLPRPADGKPPGRGMDRARNPARRRCAARCAARDGLPGGTISCAALRLVSITQRETSWLYDLAAPPVAVSWRCRMQKM